MDGVSAGEVATLFEVERALYLTFSRQAWGQTCISEDRKDYLQGAHQPNTTV